ncbi:hypothetical protein MARCHEWKA_03450 [Brevundimonas phage vB_BpoS-Marchewka]|uniref:Uncharacterized protein n=1 Tax=Brevundimonas phage vB_BpoS-Marchewka TaxID=2948604 RepID=A0A9E7N5K7_9CAUD|nr:hypothetical protein MARCHEWKA_03450 [Brevundimonas phage vB_BpoS-Marchewka]UTC29303.1 hypothetical protein BAMBUS_02210 [Brevundimonas phage vB_BpoS-Bambus]
MSRTIDLRHEPALGDSEWTMRSDASRVQSLLVNALLRDGPWLSPNARTQLQEMKSDDWVKTLLLADVIENGDARQDDAEHDLLYESYPDLVDTVIDLFNMVSRRDEQINALQHQLGEVAALTAEMARGVEARDALIDLGSMLPKGPEPS